MCACPASEYQSKQFSYVHTIVAHQFPSQNWSITAQCKTKRHHHGLARSRPYLVVEQYFNVGCFCGVLRWRLHATYCRFQLTTQSTHGDAHLNSCKRVGRAAYQFHSSLQWNPQHTDMCSHYRSPCTHSRHRSDTGLSHTADLSNNIIVKTISVSQGQKIYIAFTPCRPTFILHSIIPFNPYLSYDM